LETSRNHAPVIMNEYQPAKITQHFKDLRKIDYFFYLRNPIDPPAFLASATASC
jgi:hypothetical protein